MDTLINWTKLTQRQAPVLQSEMSNIRTEAQNAWTFKETLLKFQELYNCISDDMPQKALEESLNALQAAKFLMGGLILLPNREASKKLFSLAGEELPERIKSYADSNMRGEELFRKNLAVHMERLKISDKEVYKRPIINWNKLSKQPALNLRDEQSNVELEINAADLFQSALSMYKEIYDLLLQIKIPVEVENEILIAMQAAKFLMGAVVLQPGTEASQTIFRLASKDLPDLIFDYANSENSDFDSLQKRLEAIMSQLKTADEAYYKSL